MANLLWECRTYLNRKTSFDHSHELWFDGINNNFILFERSKQAHILIA